MSAQIVYTGNQSYQFPVNWGYSESQVPRHQPGSNLASGLFEDSSDRPAVFILFCTGWLCLLNHRHICFQHATRLSVLKLTLFLSAVVPITSLLALFPCPSYSLALRCLQFSVPPAAQHHLIPAWLRQLSEQASPIPFDIPPI